MIFKYLPFVGAVMATLMLTGCGKSEKKVEKTLTLTASGSSFVYPVMTKWAEQYNEKHAIQVNYQATGSGAGIKQVSDRLVDFAATDQPLTEKELQQNKLIQFPVVLGGIVVVVNLPNAQHGTVLLDGNILADIFLGHITHWQDPSIQELNPDVTFPDQSITVVHRADGSGTTYNFSEYLSKVSMPWAQKVGVGSSVKWPVGVGAKGNAGVATYVQRMQGAIGYVEYAYALQQGLAGTKLKNHDGQIVEPTVATFQAAIENVDWKAHPDFNVSLTDQPGAQAWPMTATVFILMPADPKDPEKQKLIFDFFNWIYTEGDAAAQQLDYIPLPKDVVSLIEASWKK